jgi:hypothetical protein
MSHLFNRFAKQGGPPGIDLRRPLIHLSPKDPWRLQDAVEGSIIFGATGSGKTSGSGETIAKSLLRAGCGGLVLTAKGDEAKLWERYCRETGRELIVFSPASGHTFNFMEYEQKRSGAGAGLTENLVMLFCTVLEVAERSGGTGSAPDYWQRAVRQLLRNTIDLAQVARGTVTVDLLHSIVTTSPQSPEELESEDWQQSSTCMACIRDGEQKAKTPEESHDFAIAVAYFLKEFAALNPRTRSCIVSTFTTMSDLFLRGVIHRMLCTTTDLQIPEATHDGKVVLLDLPVKEFDQVGQLVQVLIKYIWQRATERRDLARYPRPCFLWADECQLFVTASDATFQTTARSSRAATVYLTQSLSNFHAALGGGERGKALTHSLLGNLQTKVFHQNGDSVTNHYAAELFAKSWQFRGSAGTSTSEADSGPSRVSRNAGGSDSLEYEVLPQEFTMLRKGGTEHHGLVDGIVFQGGRRFRATGKNYLRVTFRQNPTTNMSHPFLKHTCFVWRQMARLAQLTLKALLTLLPPSVEVFLHCRIGVRYFPRIGGSLLLFLLYRHLALLLPRLAGNNAEWWGLTVYAVAFTVLSLLHLTEISIRRVRGDAPVHSQTAGVPWALQERGQMIPPLLWCFLEPLLGFLLGVFLGRWSTALALWLKAASVALFLKSVTEWWGLRSRALDAQDARIEGKQVTGFLETGGTAGQQAARRSFAVSPGGS